MTVAFVSSASGSDNNTTTLTVSAPASIVAGNVLLAYLTNSGAAPTAGPTGWTQLSSAGTANAAWWKLATSSEPTSYTWTFGAGTYAEGLIVQYSGVGSTPIDTYTNNSATGTAITSTAATNSAAGETYVLFLGAEKYAVTFTTPSGLTLEASVSGIYPISAYDAVASTTSVASISSTLSATATWGATVISLTSATNQPVFTADSPSSPGIEGDAYSYTYTASGSPAPTFTVASGTIPAGLTLTSAGVLSGTYTTVGTYVFTVTASNSAGTTTSPSTTIVVNEGVAQTTPNNLAKLQRDASPRQNPYPTDSIKPLTISVRISTPGGWLELNDPKNGYQITADSLVTAQSPWRSQDVNNIWTEGTFSAGAVRDNVTETLNVYCRGATSYEVAVLRRAFQSALEQLVYNVLVVMEDVAEMWTCPKPANYTVASQQEFRWARMCEVQAQIFRLPTVDWGIATGDDMMGNTIPGTAIALPAGVSFPGISGA
jgi:hypothetical protein